MTEDSYIEIYNKALDILSRREHSQKELSDKLLKKFSNQDLIEQSIQKLEDNCLVNDERFSEHYVAARKRKGFGPKKISYELVSKGVEKSIVSKAIFESGEWKELARQVFNKKFKEGVAVDFKLKNKQKNFLINRGFSFTEIESVFN
nr:recombination regulator RecX [Gammaproteobacteria bacterium]